VIVIDNNSQDGTVAMVQERFPQVRIIANTYNYGFARATNQGYRISQGRYVMTLNPDTRFLEGDLDKIIDFLEANPHVGMVGPKSSDTTSLNKYPIFILQKMRNYLSLYFGGREEKNAKVGPTEVSWLWGTGIVCRREALGPEKFFDEHTFLYGEEYWLILRMRKNGYAIYQLPHVQLNHAVHSSSPNPPLYSYKRKYLAYFVLYTMVAHEMGLWRAKLYALMGLIDAILLWMAVGIKHIFSPMPHRSVALADWRGKAKASYEFLLRGVRHLPKVNAAVERFFNKAFPAIATKAPI